MVTGWDVSAAELRATAARIVAAKKLFNIQAGWTPDEDTLPARLLDNALPDDARALLTRDRLQQLVRAYNVARGWTADGHLTPEGIAELQGDPNAMSPGQSAQTRKNT